MAPTQCGGDAEPIAIIGIGVRFPGESHSSEAFWDMLKNGRDGWLPIPKHRFDINGYYHPDPARAGSICFKGSHFLGGEYEQSAKQFDAPFFNITAAEVEGSDPQHLHMLEVSYEALENAGVPMQNVAGSDTSVYVGCFTRDWEGKGGRDPYSGPFYAATGNGMSMLANRVSWFYDMRGPSMTVDTACSSSLYAVHLAAQSLRTGESKMAIAGGTNIICDPCYMRDLTTMSFLSPDGRCHSFDSRANGYGRGDGIGAVVLKTVSQAIKDGDTIRAVIRSSGLGQDGRTPGITMPSPEAQADLIRSVYRNAGLNMDQTAYFEAHGTGTAIGDPYELSALGATFGSTRADDNPLYVGSVKANIGHLEGGAGIAGLIKAALVVERGQIPPLADLKTVNSRLKLEEWKVALPTELIDWPISGVRRASVNCFGYGGANAHVIVDDAYHFLRSHGLEGHHQTVLGPLDTAEDSDGSDSGFESPGSSALGDSEISRPRLFVLSAVDQAGIQRSGNGLANFLGQQTERKANEKRVGEPIAAIPSSSLLRNLAYTLASRRTAFDHRSFLVADSVDSILNEVQNPLPKLRRTAKNTNMFFVFTGQGAQWATMGKSLMSFDTYRDSLARAQDKLDSLSCSWSLTEELFADKTVSNIDQPEFSQPLCTALQIALVDLLADWGVSPRSVVGHSSGEIAAAYTAGLVTHEQAVHIAYCRGQLSADVNRRLGETRGAMMAVALSPEEVQPYLDLVAKDAVVVACVNSPSSVTLSGDETAIAFLERALQDASIFARKLKVKTAYHSPHMKVIAEDYLASMSDIALGETPMAPKATMFSSVTGGTVLKQEDINAAYWVSNMLGQVRFGEAVRALLTEPANPNSKSRRRVAVAYSAMVEVGPAEALKGPLLQILNATDGKLTASLPYTSALSRNSDAARTALAAAGKLWAHGLPVNLSKINFPSEEAAEPLQSLACLPPYAWNHKVYEHTSAYGKTVLGRSKPRTDLLGFSVETADPQEPRWRNYIRLSEQPWISDHRVQQMVVYPGSAMVVQAFEAARSMQDPARELKALEARNIVFKKGLVIPSGDTAAETEIHLKPRRSAINETEWSFTLFSRLSDDDWNETCSGSVSLIYSVDDYGEEERNWRGEVERYHDIQKRACRILPAKTLYKIFDDKMNLQYGPLHRNITECVAGFAEGLGTLTIPDTQSIMPAQFEFAHTIHPVTLDSVFHLQALGYLHVLTGDESLVPISIDTIRVAADFPTLPGTQLKGYSKGTVGNGWSVGDITLSDDWQAPKIEVRGFFSKDISAPTAVPSSSSDFSPRKCTRIDYIPLADLAFSDENAAVPSDNKVSTALILTPTDATPELSQLAQELLVQLASRCEHIAILHPEQISAPGLQANGATVISLLELENCYVHNWNEKQFTWLRDLTACCEALLWVTRGADVTEPDSLMMSISTGLFRTIRSEKPQLRVFQLDLERSIPISADITIDALTEAFEVQILATAKAVEQELVQRNGKLHAPRLATDDSFHAELAAVEFAAAPVQQTVESLQTPARATLSATKKSLHFVADPDATELGTQDVRIAPAVVMVNTSSIEHAGQLGQDAVGTVLAVGSSVSRFAPGDVVLACASGTLRTALAIQQDFVQHKPRFIGAPVAVNIPSAITLAHLAMIDLCGVNSGMAILLDAQPDNGSGAMIYLAKHLGATLFASFETPYHRRWLIEQIGLDEEYVIQRDREDRVKQSILRRNGGKGLDVLITDRGRYLNCLAPFGRCVSIGQQPELSPQPLASGVTIQSLDLDELRTAAPEIVAKAYKQAWSLAQDGIFHSLPPKRMVDISELCGEDRRELPKEIYDPRGVAVSLNPTSMISVRPNPPSVLSLDPEATYVLSGGLGGIGRSIAEAMYALGARKITFISRSGAKSAEATKLLASLQQRGCDAQAVTCDVSSPSAVEDFAKGCEERGERIKGVVQAAMVLRDAVFDNMTFEQWQKGISPKVQGTWNLHKFFPADMDWFICLSSMAGVIGNPGQCNYSAAGTFQDAIAVHRRKQGLKAVTIDLGVVSDVGYIAENPEQFERLNYLKPLFISERDIRLLLSAAMLGQTKDGIIVPPQVITGVGKELMADGSIGSAMAADLKYSSLHGNNGKDSGDASEDDATQEALKGATTLLEAAEVVERQFAAQIAAATSMETGDVDLERPMHAYGVDSLAAVEVRNMIFRRFKSDVSVFDILSTLPLSRLAVKVVARSKIVKNDVQMTAQEESTE